MAMETYLRVIPMGSDPWVAIINGIKYSYPAGTEQEVPEEVAVLIDAQERHEQPKYPPVQGGGDMLVTITAVAAMSTEAEPQYVADKTFAEISEAIESGKNVRAMFNVGGTGCFLFNIASYEQNAMVMFSVTLVNPNMVMMMGLMIDSAGNVKTVQKMI